MQYIHGKTDFHFENTCVTIGKFDGLHLGHQLLLDKLNEYRASGMTSVVFTFDMQPMELLMGRHVGQLTSEEEKVELLGRRGPDVLISYPFTRETADTPAEDFIRDVLAGRLGAKVIVMGDDFRFGRERGGDAALLKSLEDKYGYRTVVCPRVELDGEIVSSSLIRQKLAQGQDVIAEKMLGRSYFD